ncbi:hypothetical protein SAMN04488688_108114 [Paenibacillus sp. cl141a]|nr:hypothetical protein SAMN04488688_108114 [Paenibacillus sp. cl141a]
MLRLRLSAGCRGVLGCARDWFPSVSTLLSTPSGSSRLPADQIGSIHRCVLHGIAGSAIFLQIKKRSKAGLLQLARSQNSIRALRRYDDYGIIGLEFLLPHIRQPSKRDVYALFPWTFHKFGHITYIEHFQIRAFLLCQTKITALHEAQTCYRYKPPVVETGYKDYQCGRCNQHEAFPHQYRVFQHDAWR